MATHRTATHRTAQKRQVSSVKRLTDEALSKRQKAKERGTPAAESKRKKK